MWTSNANCYKRVFYRLKKSIGNLKLTYYTFNRISNSNAQIFMIFTMLVIINS